MVYLNIIVNLKTGLLGNLKKKYLLKEENIDLAKFATRMKTNMKV